MTWVALVSAALMGCGGDDDPAPGTGGSGGGGSGACEGQTCDLPTQPQALLTFLQAKSYASFAAESAAHPSAGPHGSVRTFVGPKLDQSLAAGNTTHPPGSGTVKELFDSNGDPNGWAVWVKTQTDSAGGDGIYWYEIFGDGTGTPVADGQGVPLCKKCHAASTSDFFLGIYPLQ